jgi:DNA-binding MarR family transcriptional regulator
VAAVRSDRADSADEIALALRFLELANDVTRAYALHVRGRYGLSLGRLGLLLLLERHQRPPRPADLAAEIGCSRVTVTRLVHGLVRDGFVSSHADRDDGRARRIVLTPAGTRLVRQLGPLHGRRLHALLWHTSRDDRRDLDRLIHRLRAGLRALSSP